LACSHNRRYTDIIDLFLPERNASSRLTAYSLPLLSLTTPYLLLLSLKKSRNKRDPLIDSMRFTTLPLIMLFVAILAVLVPGIQADACSNGLTI
jgi:hypothetical protein